ncbi:MAG: hypothetical protein KDA96_16860, partial [Planctomycetaceae bacterium]|nr:hypothetical protein [Planctomycetaceae bacterium]
METAKKPPVLWIVLGIIGFLMFPLFGMYLVFFGGLAGLVIGMIRILWRPAVGASMRLVNEGLASFQSVRQ